MNCLIFNTMCKRCPQKKGRLQFLDDNKIFACPFLEKSIFNFEKSKFLDFTLMKKVMNEKLFLKKMLREVDFLILGYKNWVLSVLYKRKNRIDKV